MFKTGGGTAVMPDEKPKTKSKGGRPKVSERDDVVIKIDRKLAAMVKLMATRNGVGSAEILSALAKEPIERAYRKVMTELPGADQ